MSQPVDHLAEAKGILNQQPDDLGDHDLALVVAHATVALAEAVNALSGYVENQNAIVVRHT